MRKHWKDRLNEIKSEMAAASDPHKKSDEASVEALNDVKTRKIRLLKASEETGIVKLPLIITSYYVRKSGWQSLALLGGQKIHGRYLLIDMPLFGVSEKLASESSLGTLDVITQLYNDHKGEDTSNHVLSGHVRKKGDHYYVPLVDERLARSGTLKVYNWDFAPSTFEMVPDVTSSVDTLIASNVASSILMDIHVK